MYKALDVRDNTEVVILDPKWLRAINQLRELDHQDFLVCQGCQQPVRVRAGEQRREHFAHKHLENCDYADESTVIRNARAVLYEWLVSKFGEKVTIEKKIEGTDLFRPIDCWIEQDSKVFAYWIFDSTLKPEKRNVLQQVCQKLGVHFNWVFVSEILRTEKDNPDNLVLSTTEREFLQRSEYDLVAAKGNLTDGSLHYLDSENRKLITYRRLSLYHQPQIYKGLCVTSELDTVKVSPKNGEFVHNGEHERLQKFKQQQEILPKPNLSKREGYFARKYPDFETPESHSENVEHHGSVEIQNENKVISHYPSPAVNSSYNSYQSKSGVCVFCGQVTYDWWWHNGKTGECKCKACLKEGKY